MGLKEYRNKRNFRKTPEPEGKRGQQARPAHLYLIQKHDASRLHYDLRLELDGVLKSWAVPKGPSLDPGQRRLAVQVEDHPVEYGDFEGIIPEEEYGGGTVMLWDRGQWEPLEEPQAGYRKGHLKFRLHGSKLRGEWTLARMGGSAGEGGKNWLLIKKRDGEARAAKEIDILTEAPLSVISGRSLKEIAAESTAIWHAGETLARESVSQEKIQLIQKERKEKTADILDPSLLKGAVRAELPGRLSPQKATLASQPPAGEDWFHEVKFDGYRILCRIDRSPRLFTRNGKDWTKRFDAVARAAAGLPKKSVYDGEVVVLRPDGTTDFQALQNVLQGIESGEIAYYIFDLLYFGGYDLTAVPLRLRKQFLRQVLAGHLSSTIRYGDHIQGNGEVVLEQACRLGLEGIVSKRVDSSYVQKRTRSWLKIKCLQRQEFVLGGFTDPAGSRPGLGALLVGYYRGGDLIFAGRVGTGFSERLLRSLRKKLDEMVQDSSPFANPPASRETRGVHWLRPELVAEVEFTGWTNDDLLRHPSFKGLREDKPPPEVVRERPAGGLPARGRAGASRGRKGRQEVRVAGVALTNPDRVLYPQQGVTKEELARFYAQISGWILPQVLGRPLTLLRCPEGHEAECFYQKHFTEALPAGLGSVPIREKEGVQEYIVIEELPGLIGLVQLGVLEFHPWGARADRVEQPDRLIFDLDPGPGVGWPELAAGARLLRESLADLGLASFVKTTGGKGLHVTVPLVRRSDWQEAKSFARAVVERMAGKEPRKYVATMSKAKRQGRIYLDYLRNSRGATAVAPYSTRARAGAPVATPLRWEELAGDLTADTYTIHNLPRRLAQLNADPWQEMAGLRQSITRRMKEKLGMD